MERPVTFIDACLSGSEKPDNVDGWVDRWHKADTELSLPEWLGMTDEEYGHWAIAPGVLPHIIAIRRLSSAARIEVTHAVAKDRGSLN